jgi:hypothetical protein
VHVLIAPALVENDMAQAFAEPVRRVRLTFRDHDELAHAHEPVRSELSAITSAGSCLFTANDELATVERLVRQDDGRYGRHQPFHMADFFELPDGGDGGMDIEGLDVADGYLWVVGSHSLSRAKPKPHEHDAAEALARLTEVRHRVNRHFLGRVPLVERDQKGVLEPAAEARDGVGKRRRAASLKLSRKGGKLDALLADDIHIGRFMGVPAKENGFDIEGIAARGDRVFLGLRGPVLRGWAMVLELALEEKKPGQLRPRKIGPDGHRYAKHFLDLAGLGIRELQADGDDLLILAGPTMDLDGPVTLFRWPNFLETTEQNIVPASKIEKVLEIPYGAGIEHAEGMCWPGGDGARRELLVVYDMPSPDREHDDGATIDADVFSLECGPAKPPRGRKAVRSASHRTARKRPAA